MKEETSIQELKDLMKEMFINIDKRFAESTEKWDKNFVESRVEWDKNFVESRVEWDKNFAESKAEWDKNFAESRVEWDKNFAESKAEWDKRSAAADRRGAEIDRRLRKLEKLRDDLGLTQGEVAEDGIRRSVEIVLDGYNIQIHEVRLRVKVVDKKTKKTLGEYDIVAVNDKEVVAIEVKNKLSQKHVEHFLAVQLPKFKRLLPEYKNYKLYGGVGGLVVKPEIEKFAESKGLFVFTQNGDGFEVCNKKNFKPKEYA